MNSTMNKIQKTTKIYNVFDQLDDITVTLEFDTNDLKAIQIVADSMDRFKRMGLDVAYAVTNVPSFISVPDPRFNNQVDLEFVMGIINSNTVMLEIRNSDDSIYFESRHIELYES